MDRSITHTVQLVLALRDVWDDRLIGVSDFAFYVDEERVHPIRKATGHYVFIDLKSDVFRLRIEHRKFYPKVLEIDLNDIAALGFVLETPLVPNMASRLPLNCVNLYGNADPCTYVYVYAVESRSRSRVQFVDFKASDILVVNNPGQLPLVGATLAVVDPVDLQLEVFTVLKKYSCEEYKINKALIGKYKEGSMIVKAYVGVANDDGIFSVFVSKKSDCRDYIIMFSNDGKLQTETFSMAENNLMLKVM
ncbi:MAG: hypothetical protein LBJ38_01970 [Oscillospiraceae bacterium]|nr:hypothetical protein [Oscillospiraceae bacterium]